MTFAAVDAVGHPGTTLRRRAARAARRPGARCAFTLFELLLVIVISALVAGLAVPALMRTLRGERLRAAARAVVTSHRLARATAALRAEAVELRLDPIQRRIEVSRRAPPEPAADGTSAAEAAPDEQTGVPAALQRDARVIESRRAWSAEVSLIRVDVRDETLEGNDPVLIPYRPGGDCPAYAVFLNDDRGDRAIVRVDPVTGKARVEYERNP